MPKEKNFTERFYFHVLVPYGEIITTEDYSDMFNDCIRYRRVSYNNNLYFITLLNGKITKLVKI